MDRRTFIARAGAVMLREGLQSKIVPAGLREDEDCLTAAYYFGNFHVDPRNEQAHGTQWTEWNLVRSAMPRFAGHQQPKVPMWGFENEADPQVFEKKIAVAHDHGLDALIFDWYWYNDGQFLNAALEQGYLQAANNKDLKFAVMWANHDWYDIHPAKLTGPPHLQFPGKVTRETFNTMTDQLLKLFEHPSYFKIEGAPYFSLYELFRFVEGMGGIRGASDALAALRSKAAAAGLPDVHVNAVTWGVKLLPGQSDARDLVDMLHQLGVN